MIVRTVILGVILFTGLCEGARILGVFPVPSPSHYILANALMRGLAEAGHDITIISPYFDKDPPKKGLWREIILKELLEDFQKKFDESEQFQKNLPGPLMWFLIMNGSPKMMTEKVLNNTEVQNLLHSDEKFDVVIVLQLFNDALKAFANHFNAHLVLFSNSAPTSLLNSLVGNPTLPSHFPELMLGYQTHMSLIQRVFNTLFRFLTVLDSHALVYPNHNRLVQKYIPNPADLDDVLYNASLVLLNSHLSFAEAQPLVPCMIDIGGFHIKPSEKLSDDLQKFLDDAKEGVIYFSLGSNLKSKYLPEEKRDALLKAFAKRKEKVLWKWEDDTLPGQPTNVKLGKWLPQQAILAHPNTKLFITHGGMLSTIETIYHGVPIIAIPIFGDQLMNANTAEEAGYGLVLPFADLSEERLTSLLEEIITNTKYITNAMERSKIMRDRQVKPLDNAIYWIEYIIRHNGARHLRVPYLNLTWYQYYLLDVIAVIFLMTVATCFVVKKTCSYMCKRRSRRIKEKIN